MQQQPQNQQPYAPPSASFLGLKEKHQTAVGILTYPALTVQLFLRRKLGFRTLAPGKLIGMALLLMILPEILGPLTAVASFSPFGAFMPSFGRTARMPTFNLFGFLGLPEPLTLFAIAMVIYGLIQRRMRWNELKRGVKWHSHSPGISWFSFVPLSQAQVYRFIDPLVCVSVAFLLDPLSHALFLWLIFSAFSLFVVEQYRYERHLERDLDILDSLLDSEVHGETVEHFEGQPVRERSLEETKGIPTGAGADLDAQIRKRKVRIERLPT